MRRLIVVLLVAACACPTIAEEVVTLQDGRQIVVYDDHTWDYVTRNDYEGFDFSTIQDNRPPEFLRQNIRATREEIIQAIVMYQQGWRYTMPRPKSAQARWGNTDGRTTWWNGWWHNETTGQYSRTTPREGDSGLFLGDNQRVANTWSNGGSPPMPDVYMWLLSSSGGPGH